MTFIPPMLCEVLRNPARLDDPRYVAEPKFDGQRAQLHVAGVRTVAAFSRRALDLHRHPGLAWVREVRWPVTQAVLDGELCGETGSGGIQSVLEARGRRDGVTCLVAKDPLLLEVLVEDGEPELVRWGHWGLAAARLRLTYTHPRSGIRGTIDELVRVPDPERFELRRRRRAEILCWGILRPSGRLRHPVFVGWR
jgi:hypothetical protein